MVGSKGLKVLREEDRWEGSRGPPRRRSLPGVELRGACCCCSSLEAPMRPSCDYSLLLDSLQICFGDDFVCQSRV